VEEEEIVVHSCPNICCKFLFSNPSHNFFYAEHSSYITLPPPPGTGAFIQEGMMGVVMSAEVRQLIFTADRVKSRRHFPGTLEFNVPVVLTHLLGRL
jgi:hypothetical protein